MDDDELIQLNLLILIVSLLAIIIEQQTTVDKRKVKRKKRYWVKPILEKRQSEGTFKLLIPQLQFHEGLFKNFLRMTEESYEILLSLVGPIIQRKNTQIYKYCSCLYFDNNGNNNTD